MILAALWSGGKDSAYATYLALKKGYKVKFLVTMLPENKESWMFHFPCVELTKLQAKAAKIEHILKKTKGEKEKELEDLKKVLAKLEVDGVISGAIASNYQKSRIDKICEELGIKHFSPIWQEDQERVLKEEVKAGFEIIITGVFAEGFDESWLGRKIDEEAVKEILELKEKFGISPSGEGGCYETLTLDCPIFKKRLQIIRSRKIWEGMSGYLQIDEAKLVPKDIV
ncbi:MAG: TIGR00289 family protein [Candidatus Aenigmatarchaeota archaeon]